MEINLFECEATCDYLTGWSDSQAGTNSSIGRLSRLSLFLDCSKLLRERETGEIKRRPKRDLTGSASASRASCKKKKKKKERQKSEANIHQPLRQYLVTAMCYSSFCIAAESEAY